MIDTFVMDMGNVLLTWAPYQIAGMATDNPQDAALLAEEFLISEEWEKCDAGMMTYEALLESVRARIPDRLEKPFLELSRRWTEWMLPVPGAEEFVRKAHRAGYPIYLLSNASLDFPEALARQFPAFSLFSGWVVSAHEKVSKPNPRIYDILLDRFHLKPENCFFLDDLPRNIEGARKKGINAFQFDGDYSKVERILKEKGIDL